MRPSERSVRAIELQPACGGLSLQPRGHRGPARQCAGGARRRAAGALGTQQDFALALARQIGSDRAAADAALGTLIEKHADFAPTQIAEVYALRNDAKKTFEWLDRAWSNRDADIAYLLFDPFILRYKDDPRFAAFCRKVGLPTPAEIQRRT